MKRAIAATLLSAAGLIGLASCTEPASGNVSWQISQVYVTPDKPAGLPDNVMATMVLGNSTVTGNTGCAPFQGRITTDKPNEASVITFQRMRYKEADCEGSARYFHDELVRLLDGEFTVKRSERELLLTKKTDGVTAPAIRLVATS